MTHLQIYEQIYEINYSFSKGIVENQFMLRFVSFQSKVKPPTLWRCLL